MENFGNMLREMLQHQQNQQLELIKHLEESRQSDRKELDEERRKEKQELDEERRKKEQEWEEERKREKTEFHEQLLELQVKSDQKIELLAHTLRNRNEDDVNSFSQSAIWSAIDTFHHDPENGLTFEAFFSRFEDTFNIDCGQWADAKNKISFAEIG